MEADKRAMRSAWDRIRTKLLRGGGVDGVGAVGAEGRVETDAHRPESIQITDLVSAGRAKPFARGGGA